jgi:hypothetical protein
VSHQPDLPRAAVFDEREPSIEVLEASSRVNCEVNSVQPRRWLRLATEWIEIEYRDE